jgi:hypothetical protein
MAPKQPARPACVHDVLLSVRLPHAAVAELEGQGRRGACGRLLAAISSRVDAKVRIFSFQASDATLADLIGAAQTDRAELYAALEAALRDVEAQVGLDPGAMRIEPVNGSPPLALIRLAQTEPANECQ